jgi:hypothetical protein
VTDFVQDRATVMLGPDAGSLTDYTCAIRSFVINDARATVVKAPTFSNPFTEQKAASQSNTVTIDFLSEFVTSSGLWSELLTALSTRTAELYFEWTPTDDVVSASNPKRTGYLVVTDVDSGMAVGQPLRQVKTFPARDVSAPIVVP